MNSGCQIRTADLLSVQILVSVAPAMDSELMTKWEAVQYSIAPVPMIARY